MTVNVVVLFYSGNQIITVSNVNCETGTPGIPDDLNFVSEPE
ncbi:hypothetical protein Q4512_15110 [Oceanihabitans sp. 2_MG-2023]|nr:hypothetical protein [Oceanihabitans sp. 2_MG-2023]MDO6598252.1 hypothetical protein [Oceanihabitans sp. 2_MG-2023]